MTMKARSYAQLDRQERRSIAIGRQQGLSMRAIARMLVSLNQTSAVESERR